MTFADRRDAVLAEIAESCRVHGREPTDVTLLAVSKTKSVEAIQEALETPQRMFGESRVQELAQKAGQVEGVEWHMIGSVQTNKVGALIDVPGLRLLHSLDRPKLARALERVLDSRGAQLDALLQIEATGEENKHGVTLDDAERVATEIAAECPAIRLRGLMAMGPLHGEARPVFERVAELRDRLRAQLGLPLDVLSFGMSGDLDDAIASGSTLVRVGTALFGSR